MSEGPIDIASALTGGVGAAAAASWQNDPKTRFIEETGKYVHTGDDGVSYEWDEDKHAWFPMWDETLIESQQAAYGEAIIENNTTQLKQKRKKVYTSDEPKVEPKKKPNTAVYISGLPCDVTMDEMKEVFGKCGLFMEDLSTGQPRIKIYKDDQGNIKGDALVIYFKEESVALACQLLDDSDFRYGQPSRIRVQPAVFQDKPKPPPTPAANAAAAGSKIDKKVAKKKINKLEKRLDWFDETEGKKAEKFAKVVVLKHMFTSSELEEDPALLLDLKDDVRSECEKLGEVTNVVLYDVSSVDAHPFSDCPPDGRVSL
ncbi:hypothetical protein BC832DRAFT_529193 [Gaertneriomyces semiglobifer]|nr:hypothetical protein BC832DRAFT_529193 [Gaertneriomyces semiglobifer]